MRDEELVARIVQGLVNIDEIDQPVYLRIGRYIGCRFAPDRILTIADEGNYRQVWRPDRSGFGWVSSDPCP